MDKRLRYEEKPKTGLLQWRGRFILGEDNDKNHNQANTKSTTEDGGPGKLYTQSTCVIRSTLAETAKAGWAR